MTTDHTDHLETVGRMIVRMEMQLGYRPAAPDDLTNDSAWLRLGQANEIVVAKAAVAALVSMHTESPIETIFGAHAVLRLTAAFQDDFALCRCEEEINFPAKRALAIPQFRWLRYRIDWAFRFSALQQPYFFVECDGLEFHSTPDQVERDRAKDAAAELAGIPLLRFTGSQITKNPADCVDRLIWLVRAHETARK